MHTDDFYELMNNKVVEFRETQRNMNTYWNSVDVDQLSIGDKIIVYFYPQSQKDIYALYPKCGEVVKIAPPINSPAGEKLELELVDIKDDMGNIQCAAHEWTSYFGNTRGYSYNIYKLDLIIDHVQLDDITDTESTPDSYA